MWSERTREEGDKEGDSLPRHTLFFKKPHASANRHTLIILHRFFLIDLSFLERSFDFRWYDLGASGQVNNIGSVRLPSAEGIERRHLA